MAYNEDMGSYKHGQIPRKGKGAFIPGKPKAKAHQHPIDESGPAIRVGKKSEADELIVAVYREMWKDAICTGSHGLRENITNYVKKHKLIQ